jgi:hypothetical protein
MIRAAMRLSRLRDSPRRLPQVHVLQCEPGLKPGDTIMISMKEAMRRPYEALHGASDEMHAGSHSAARTSAGVGGILLIAVALAFFVWMYPELQRYLRIRRM